jgi:hypothetical protein
MSAGVAAERLTVVSKRDVPLDLAAKVTKIFLTTHRGVLTRLLLDAYFDVDPPGGKEILSRLLNVERPYKVGLFRQDPLIAIRLDPVQDNDFDAFVALAPYSIDASAWIATETGEIMLYEAVDTSQLLSFQPTRSDWETVASVLTAREVDWFLVSNPKTKRSARKRG